MHRRDGGEDTLEHGHNYIRHNYIGHNYIGPNYIDHNCIGHNYIGHNYVGHNYIGHIFTCTGEMAEKVHSSMAITIYAITI